MRLHPHGAPKGGEKREQQQTFEAEPDLVQRLKEANNAGKSAAIAAGLGATIGFFLLGPVGAAIGGGLGGALGANA